MRDAKPGMRVANRLGEEGTIESVYRGEALVLWDDGFQCHVLTSQLYPADRRVRWGPLCACAFLLAVSLAILIFA